MRSGRFAYKNGFFWKKDCYKTFSGKVVRHLSAACSTVHKWLVGGVFLYLIFCTKLTHPLQNIDFQSIFAQCASALTPSEKSEVIINRKSNTGFPISLT